MGTQHSVEVDIGIAVADIEVSFQITGPNAAASGTATTDGTGKATFTYTGTYPGEDSIMAYIDCNGNGSYDDGEPHSTADATKYWLAFFVTGGGKLSVYTVTEDGSPKKPAYTFGGNVGFLPDGSLHGQFQINDHMNKESWHCHDLFTELIFDQSAVAPAESPPAYYDKAQFIGEYTSNKGHTAVIRVRIQDRGEPGKDVDKIQIRVMSGTSLGGETVIGPYFIDGGNFQVHEGWKD